MKDAFERRRHTPTQFRGRVSIDASDPGYANHQNILADGYKIVILLNGVEQPCCVTADPDAGSILRFRTMNNIPIVHGGSVQTETVKGDVTARLERERVA